MARPSGKNLANRFSIGLDDRSHALLGRLAAEYDVSMARMARQAIAEFIERNAGEQAELPLLRREGPQAGRPG
jgi:predicted transcriptional regulator